MFKTKRKRPKKIGEASGTCEICGRMDPRGNRGWNRDHNHETGQMRGILCHSCNVGLGHFQDNPFILECAIHYLKKYKEQG